MGLMTEHYYTTRGRQRAVFLGPDIAEAVFGLEVMDGDAAAVEVSYDSVDILRRGQGVWEPFEGGAGGSVCSATALRVNIGRCDGWVKLVVKHGD